MLWMRESWGAVYWDFYPSGRHSRQMSTNPHEKVYKESLPLRHVSLS